MAKRSASELSKNTYLIAAASLLGDLSTEMLSPILPIFLTQVLGASGSLVGLIDGLAQALRNFVEGFAGVVSNKVRTRKTIVLLGYVLSAISKPLMGVSTMCKVAEREHQQRDLGQERRIVDVLARLDREQPESGHQRQREPVAAMRRSSGPMIAVDPDRLRPIRCKSNGRMLPSNNPIPTI
jgi:hypothetical protein